MSSPKSLASLPWILAAAAACSSADETAVAFSEPPPLPLPRDTSPPVVANVRPPALAGGTLLVTHDAGHVVASDPDRERIVVLEVATEAVTKIGLLAGDEPGRAVEDAAGRVHVALRRGGAVVSIDVSSGQIIGRRTACSAPRGIAFDAASERLLVACASGELVSLYADPASDAVAVRYLEPDLRDVAVIGGEIWISHLRGAEVLMLDAAGTEIARSRPWSVPEDAGLGEAGRAPSTAWRMTALPDGGVAVVHQMARTNGVSLEAPAEKPVYGSGPCGEQLVQTAITVIDAEGQLTTFSPATVSSLSLAVDLSISRNGERVAVVDATRGTVSEYRIAALAPWLRCTDQSSELLSSVEAAQPVAVAHGALHDLWVQTREPARLLLYRDGARIDTVELGGEPRNDTGYDLFHGIAAATTSTGLACASCHPEGRDDGHTWNFLGVGPRRSQSLAGTLAATAPFHWAGDLATLDQLMDDVFVRRMGGPPESPERVAALQSWLELLPPVRVAAAALDPQAVSRGKALFESAEAGCASCHGGPSFTNNQTVSVGTGAALQVPSLVGVSTRAPLMHDGCAANLFERFEPDCGGGDAHGKTSQLSAAAIADLVAYMRTL